jgi:hypothetical protein
MIESSYWKQKLLKAAIAFEQRVRQRIWSVRSIVLFERELVIAFFCIRKLIEANKLTDECEEQKIQVRSFPNRGGRTDLMSLVQLDNVYDLLEGTPKDVSIGFVSNQLIHSYFIFPAFSRRRRLAGVWVTSDFERYKALYRIPIAPLVKAIRRVADDRITQLDWKHGKRDGEWDIDTKRQRRGRCLK